MVAMQIAIRAMVPNAAETAPKTSNEYPTNAPKLNRRPSIISFPETVVFPEQLCVEPTYILYCNFFWDLWVFHQNHMEKI
jgi:hypothetical protein